jgi:hypothetical protein
MTTSTISRATATPTTTTAPTEAAAADWRAELIAEHGRTREIAEAALRAELTGRLHELTGREVSPRSVTLSSERRAIAWLDGVQFRLEGLELTVVRSCLHCGVEELTSPPVRSRADLAYALAGWEPRGRQCQIEDPAEW